MFYVMHVYAGQLFIFYCLSYCFKGVRPDHEGTIDRFTNCQERYLQSFIQLVHYFQFVNCYQQDEQGYNQSQQGKY